jgi:hypothetical protein
VKFALSAEQLEVVDAYAAARRESGIQADHVQLWGARAFYVHYGGIEGWAKLSLEQQLAAHRHVRRFVGWLIAIRRLQPTPDYLVAHRCCLGEIAARQDAAFFARFRATALQVGFSELSVKRQWVALSQVCALLGTAPENLTHAQLDAARAALTRRWTAIWPAQAGIPRRLLRAGGDAIPCRRYQPASPAKYARQGDRASTPVG